MDSEHADIFTTNASQKPIDSAEKDLVMLEANKRVILRVIFIVWLVSTVFLFLRILFEGIGASPFSGFSAFIYIISGIFLLPFVGMFPSSHNNPQPGTPVLDASAFVAMFSYTLLAILAAVITYFVIRMRKTSKQVDETVKKDHPVDPTKSEVEVK